jgi:hypothetical protein
MTSPRCPREVRAVSCPQSSFLLMVALAVLVREEFVRADMLKKLIGVVEKSDIDSAKAALEVLWVYGEGDDSRRELLGCGVFQLFLANLHRPDLYDAIIGGLWGLLEYTPLQDLAVPYIRHFAQSFEAEDEFIPRQRRELVHGIGSLHMVISNPSCLGAVAMCAAEQRDLLHLVIAEVSRYGAELTNTEMMHVRTVWFVAESAC